MPVACLVLMTPSSTASEEEDCRLAEEEQKKEEEVAVRCGLCSITLSRIVVRIGEVAVSFLSNSGSTTIREGSRIHGIQPLEEQLLYSKYETGTQH